MCVSVTILNLSPPVSCPYMYNCRLLSAIPLLIRQLSSLPDVDNISIAFPDEGAWKRFHSELVQWPNITCTKVRDGDKRVVSIKDGEKRNLTNRESVYQILFLILDTCTIIIKLVKCVVE